MKQERFANLPHKMLEGSRTAAASAHRHVDLAPEPDGRIVRLHFDPVRLHVIASFRIPRIRFDRCRIACRIVTHRVGGRRRIPLGA
ncbi:hypothetical protein [Raoultibacter massiliensis]|uniref:Uncharacterized protein n=1 Tax=Raoultibacter massiliensis TaxID=1852371 RepID=A0ABV1JCW9_9ACTN